jgi:trans-2,3-dihydro-3-hydroxyanthranilate isomerase
VTHPLHIVDVFAEAPLAGNQLAVVLDADDLSTAAMQSIAREMNFSETSFVMSREAADAGFAARIFTPTAELPFAGHPTLGTAWVIRNEIAPGAERVTLSLGVGAVPVRFDGDLAWLTAPPIRLGETYDHAAIAAAVGLSADDLDTRYPVQRIDAGIVVTTVPLRTLDALKRSRLDAEKFTSFADQDFPAVHLFCPEPYAAGNDLAARFFFEAAGPREDPATGSATACLGAYLFAHDYFATPGFSLRVEQGVEIGRPSLLYLEGRRVAGEVEIQVGGRVIPSVRGELL